MDAEGFSTFVSIPQTSVGAVKSREETRRAIVSD